MTKRGFGIAAATLSSLIAPLATAAEATGYSTFWVNDTPGSDGFEALRLAAEATTSIRLGVGVIPIDRRPASEIVQAIGQKGLPVDRLLVGVGAGGELYGSLDNVRSAVQTIREQSGAPVAIGALGPKMVSLAAREADAVLLNWLTPRQARLSARDVRAEQGEGHHCEVIAYVRVALPGGFEQLSGEGDRYASFPAYARHFARMQAQPLDTSAYGTKAEIQNGLAAFDREVDETVVRAVAEREALDAYMGILTSAKPPSAK
ncbi:MAG: LLM class flavin-dependent oxidoreductase [Thermomicrobiales bacterium]|nr:LLM class flavin-dependent oxidoreductase [Thermomicrobiales bacterium]MCO5221160.1 LLM class flavin-dependent oxidoreductase [Thermomicrobiales bacterium]